MHLCALWCMPQSKTNVWTLNQQLQRNAILNKDTLIRLFCTYSSVFLFCPSLAFLGFPDLTRLKNINNQVIAFSILTTHASQDSFYKWIKISSFEIDIFGLKMMVKSGLESFILKFIEALQSYLLTCLANSAFLNIFVCAGQQQL